MRGEAETTQGRPQGVTATAVYLSLRVDSMVEVATNGRDLHGVNTEHLDDSTILPTYEDATAGHV